MKTKLQCDLRLLDLTVHHWTVDWRQRKCLLQLCFPERLVVHPNPVSLNLQIIKTNPVCLVNFRHQKILVENIYFYLIAVVQTGSRLFNLLLFLTHLYFRVVYGDQMSFWCYTWITTLKPRLLYRGEEITPSTMWCPTLLAGLTRWS